MGCDDSMFFVQAIVSLDKWNTVDLFPAATLLAVLDPEDEPFPC